MNATRNTQQMTEDFYPNGAVMLLMHEDLARARMRESQRAPPTSGWRGGSPPHGAGTGWPGGPAAAPRRRPANCDPSPVVRHSPDHRWSA